MDPARLLRSIRRLVFHPDDATAARAEDAAFFNRHQEHRKP